MSKGQTLRALVKERLTAAADEIFVLFERTIAEYEVELCRSNEENQRKQRLLDSTLNPRVLLHNMEAGARIHSQGPSMNHEVTETPEQLPEPVPEILFCVKTETSLLKEEPKEEDISPRLQFPLNTEDTWNSSDTDNSENWGPAFSFSALQMDNLFSEFKSSHGISATVNKRPTSGTGEGAGRPFPDSEITFQCSVCQKRFGSKADLQSHNRVHTGERPFSCPTCQRAFKEKCHLAMHLKRHTGEKPYSCPICNKVFLTRGLLKAHKKSHTAERPFSCPTCQRTFKQKCHLAMHLKRHTGEKPYSCSICKGAFVTRGVLKVHHKSHTGERPYACSICNQTFTQKSYRNAHSRRNHPESHIPAVQRS